MSPALDLHRQQETEAPWPVVKRRHRPLELVRYCIRHRYHLEDQPIPLSPRQNLSHRLPPHPPRLGTSHHSVPSGGTVEMQAPYPSLTLRLPANNQYRRCHPVSHLMRPIPLSTSVNLAPQPLAAIPLRTSYRLLLAQASQIIQVHGHGLSSPFLLPPYPMYHPPRDPHTRVCPVRAPNCPLSLQWADRIAVVP